MKLQPLHMLLAAAIVAAAIATPMLSRHRAPVTVQRPPLVEHAQFSPRIFTPPPLGGPPQASPASQQHAQGVNDAQSPAPMETPHSRDLAGCDCPKLPVLSDDAHAAKGLAGPPGNPWELTYDDLHALFGTRDVKYGSWPAAIAALEHEIDPTGALGISKAPEPAVVDARPLTEGLFANMLITGEWWQSNTPGRRPNPFDSRHYLEHDAGIIVYDLLATVARSEKYGEPAAGIRDAALRLAHFLTVELVSVNQLWGPKATAHGNQLRTVNTQAFIVLFLELGATLTNPAAEQIRAKRLGIQGDNKLVLTEFDLAQAALEVLTFGDETHDIDAAALAHDPTVEGRAGVLITLAAAAQRFGGPAPPNSDMGIIACRAYSALVTYLAAKDEDAVKLRQAMLEAPVYGSGHYGRWSNPAHTTPPDEPKRHVILALVAQQGPMTSQEADADVDGLSTTLISGGADDLGRQMTADLFAALLGSSGDAMGEVRARAENKHQEYIERDNFPVSNPYKLTSEEHKGLVMWPGGSAVAVTQNGSAESASAAGAEAGSKSGPTCTNGTCNIEMLRQDSALPGKFDWRPVITVISSRATGKTDGVDSVARDEPFTINVTVPNTENAGGRIEVHIAGAHGNSDYALRIESEDKTTIHYTSMSPVTFEGGGGGAYGFFRKFMETPVNEWFWHNHGDFRKMDTDDGEVVALSVGDATVPLVVYENSWTKRIADNNRSLNALWAYYDDLLQNATVPDSMKAPDGAIHRRLHWIADYRQIMEYQSKPDDHFIFSVVSKADIGDTYLRMLQLPDTWENNELSGVQFTHFQAFPNVTYSSWVEGREVTLALEEAQREVKDDVWHNAAGLTIAYYDGFVAGSCFLIQHVSGGLAPCADQVWTLLTGTDAHGNEVSGTEYAATALQVASPVIEHAASVAMEAYAERTARQQAEFETINQAASQETEAEVQLARRSQLQVQETIADFQDVDVPVGALNKREKLRLATAPTVVGSVEAKVVRGPPMLMQKYDNNCFLTSLEWVRERRGLPPKTQEQMIAKAWRYEQLGKELNQPKWRVYGAREGTFWTGQQLIAETEGFEIETVESLTKQGFLKKPYVSVNQMQQALKNGHDVMAVVDSTQPVTEKLIRVLRAAGKTPDEMKKLGAVRSYHSVVVTDVFKDGTGTLRVTYGDPWNGKFWTVDACTFDIRSDPRQTIIIR